MLPGVGNRPHQIANTRVGRQVEFRNVDHIAGEIIRQRKELIDQERQLEWRLIVPRRCYDGNALRRIGFDCVARSTYGQRQVLDYDRRALGMHELQVTNARGTGRQCIE